jgi:NADPH:quinone reductase-like Zn-dependent oxidoreductase
MRSSDRTLPSTMRAVVLTGHGGLDKVAFESAWPRPEPNEGEVLIEVHACGVNNTDVNTRIGWYAQEAGAGSGAEVEAGGWTGSLHFPRIQGADVCGRVVAVGHGATAELLGRRVLVDPWLRDWDAPLDLDRCGYLGSERDGGFADFVSVPTQNVHPVDSPLSDVELASFPTASITAENMLEHVGVEAGEDVLVTGASGGVGSALVQLARGRGAKPIAICSREKSEAVRALGAAAVVDRDERDLRHALCEATGRGTVDVVADVVGGERWPSLIDVLRRGGRYVCSGAIAGPMVELDLRTLYLADLTFVGATVTAPHLFGDLVRAIERGELRPTVAATFPLEQLRAAQQMFLAKRHVGNIVIDLRAKPV